MKAYQVGAAYGAGSLTIVHKERPVLQPTEVLIEIKAVSLNYRDKLVVNGIWKPPVGRIPVSDGVGIIIEIGSHVKNLLPGDRVAGLFFPQWINGKPTPEKLLGSLGGITRDGMLQQQIALDENEVIKVPDYLSNEEAACLPCTALVAWHALAEASIVNKGDTVLIQGSGAVSLFSLQFAKMLGATVIAISGSDEKILKLKHAGADKAINYTTQPDWEKHVLEVTGGKGVDLVIETVGGDNINRSINAVAVGGSIAIIGMINGFSGKINTAEIMEKNIRLQGVVVGSKAMFENMNRALEEYKIIPFIDSVFPFTSAKQAFERLEAGNNFGKICITV